MMARSRIVAMPLGTSVHSRPIMAAFAVCVFGLVLPTATAADPTDAKPAKPKASSASSLDDELFKDLSVDAQTGKKSEPAKPGPTVEPMPTGAKPSESKPSTDQAPGTKPAERKTSPQNSLDPLDAELLKDLGGDAEPKPKKKPNDAPHGSSSENRPAGGEPTKGGGDEPMSGEPQSDDPLVRLTRRVRDAEQRLRRTDSGEQTQELQRGIVEDLENLIAQIEKQKAQQSNSQSKSKSPPGGAKPGPKKPGPPKPGSQPGDKPSSNPTDSSDQLTAKKTEKPETGKLKEMLEKVWGRLPERERQDVMQSSFEDFPAKYQYSIEQYFRTLLERKD